MKVPYVSFIRTQKRITFTCMHSSIKIKYKQECLWSKANRPLWDNESIHTWLHVHRVYYPDHIPPTHPHPIPPTYPYPIPPNHPHPIPPIYLYPIPPNHPHPILLTHPHPIPPTYPYPKPPTPTL